MAYNFNQIKEDFISRDDDIINNLDNSEKYDFHPSDECFDYCYFNPNPRGAETGDCVKRAIVVATGKDYKELELDMNRNKRVKSERYNYRTNYTHYIEDILHGKYINMSVPKGRAKWHVNTIKKIIGEYPDLTAILVVSHHLIGIRDNTIFDLFDDRPRDKGIYKMYLFGVTDLEAAKIQSLVSEGDTKRFTL